MGSRWREALVRERALEQGRSNRTPVVQGWSSRSRNRSRRPAL